MAESSAAAEVRTVPTLDSSCRAVSAGTKPAPGDFS
jgi:hypothetical protein